MDTRGATRPCGLAESLRVCPVSQAVQDDLTTELYGVTGSLSQTYFDFYAKRIRRHLMTGKPFCLEKHSDIVWVGNMIMGGSCRNEVRQGIRTEMGDDGNIEDAIDLCASLVAMMEMESPVHNSTMKSYAISGRTPVYWENGSLQSVLANHFVPQRKHEADNQKLGRVFTALNINQISAIEIRWTTNLADHLRLVDDDRALFIFQGARFLQFQNNLQDSILPKPLISETLDTLALLFPSTDQQTRRWLKTIRSKHNDNIPEPDIAKCGALRTSQRRIENFSIWHDRLVILKQAFDESQPSSLSQWWFDRRNRVQWYTFWVAILVFIMTMVFGIVQSVEGGLQVYLSYKGLRQG